MQVIQNRHDGLQRGYAITVPAAQVIRLRDERLTEIASTVPVAGFRRGEAPWTVVMQRFGASVLGEVLEQQVAVAVAQFFADQPLRPAQPPRIEVGRFDEGSDLVISLSFEELPGITLPDLTGLPLERLRAVPGAAQRDAAFAHLAARHGTLEDMPPRPVAPDEILVCDIDGRLPVDLLANGPGLGARPGDPGLAPAKWAIDVAAGLQREITATGLERGLPYFDVRVRGTSRAGAFLRVFPAPSNGLGARSGQMLTLCMRGRVVAGAMPPDSSARLGFNERSENDILRGARHPVTLGEAEMRASIAMSENPQLAYARPLLEVAFKGGLDIDVTFRIGPARVFSGAEEPEASPFGGGSAEDLSIELGGPDRLPGFNGQLVGLAPGEERMVDAVLPADHAVPELANQRVRYRVTAKAVKRRRPLADAGSLARAVGLADAAALEQALLRSLQREYDARSHLRLKAALLDALVAAVDFPLPAGLVDAEYDQVWHRVQAERRAGRTDPADAGKDDATLRPAYRALAERRVRLRLVMAELATAHGLSVSDDEMAAAIRRDAARYPGREGEVIAFYRGNAAALDALRAPLMEEKVVEFLIGRAAVSERQVEPAELGAA